MLGRIVVPSLRTSRGPMWIKKKIQYFSKQMSTFLSNSLQYHGLIVNVISEHGRDNLNDREGKRTLITDTSIIYYCKALYNWNLGIIEYMSTGVQSACPSCYSNHL